MFAIQAFAYDTSIQTHEHQLKDHNNQTLVTVKTSHVKNMLNSGSIRVYVNVQTHSNAIKNYLEEIFLSEKVLISYIDKIIVCIETKGDSFYGEILFLKHHLLPFHLI